MDTHLRNGADDKRVHPHLGIVGLLLAEPGVDDVVDAVNRQRGLRDVRRYHHLKTNNIGATWALGRTRELACYYITINSYPWLHCQVIYFEVLE